MLMLVLIVFSFYMQFKGGYTGDTLSDNRISEYAEDQYNTIFSGREDGLLLVVDETTMVSSNMVSKPMHLWIHTLTV